MKTNDPLPALVRALFKQSSIVVDQDEIDRYRSALSKFDITWRTARAALGDDWRYAESLHAAGLLVRIQWPRVKDGAVQRVDTMFCVDPGDET